MKKINIMLFVFSFISFGINAQITINEGFESGMLNPSISFQSTGSFSSSPGIINNTNFGSTKVFSFGKSTCGSSCFDNYKTTLIVTFPSPTLVDSIKWKEMEIDGNWGSQGQVLLDDVVFGGATLGAMPVNSTVPNSTPQLKAISINQMVTTIKFMVNDITNASEIIMDDLQIKYTSIPKIVGYEYWFNNDYANKTTTMVTSTQQLMINQTIPTTGLMQGINTINFRSFDNSGKYSSIISHFFYKTSLTESNQAPEIVAYEYWIDNDYANAVIVNTPVQQQLNINELMSMTTLNNGVHNFHIRFKDDAGLWSSVVSHFFYKTSTSESNPTSEIVAYEYWLDNDYANAIVMNTPIQQQVNINELISMNAIYNGVHHFNIRFKDNTGLWSSVMSHFFYKTPEQIVVQNMVTEYRYWFDNDFANAVNLALTANQQINLVDNLDLTQVPKGIHEVNFQFKDTLGRWSVVLTDTIEKIALPIADFSYSAMPYCDSTVVTFTDNSIDGDEYLWNFGDGNTSNFANPTQIFFTPNTYQVSLTVTDLASGLDSTIVIPIVINSLHTSSTISETVCDSYTAPDGQIHTTSGIKTAVIPNAAG
ncbi:MAG: PKD domain-containing protein, partial [Paludibacter sp.]|nr:PKD domain-containing protein [Paludibacter sp.]